MKTITFFGGTVVVISIGVVLFYVTGWEWTGVYVPPNEGKGNWKTLWDWLELLIIPAVLTVAAILFNKAENRRNAAEADRRSESERNIEHERWQEAILDDYLDRMSNLLLSHGLRTTNPIDKLPENESDGQGRGARAVATALTHIALRRLKSIEHRDVVTSFLSQCLLLKTNTSILALADLDGLDLTQINFIGANLSNASFTESKLKKALFIRAKLYGASFRGADLSDACLNRADLSHANLANANLTNANLEGANLLNADLRNAILTNANLDGVKNFDSVKGKPQG